MQDGTLCKKGVCSKSVTELCTNCLICKRMECASCNTERQSMCCWCFPKQQECAEKKNRKTKCSNCGWSIEKERKNRKLEVTHLGIDLLDMDYQGFVQCETERCDGLLCEACFDTSVGKECARCTGKCCVNCSDRCADQSCKKVVCEKCSSPCVGCKRSVCRVCSVRNTGGRCKRCARERKLLKQKCERCPDILITSPGSHGGLEGCEKCGLRVCKRFCQLTCFYCMKNMCRCEFPTCAPVCDRCTTTITTERMRTDRTKQLFEERSLRLAVKAQEEHHQTKKRKREESDDDNVWNSSSE
jgi:hypothetical protein